ncbi:MAG: choice-of-anchor B family protein [Woeseia sp.]|nr:choice-of-anchor B family protein [Woeseia sp.]
MISFQALRPLRLAGLATAIAVIATAFIAPKQATAQVVITPGAAGQCVNGNALGYACEDVDLLAIVPSYELTVATCELDHEAVLAKLIEDGEDVSHINFDLDAGPMTGSDMWGWIHTDENGDVREYAVQGLSDAVAFIEMTDPSNPKFRGCMLAPTLNFLWRDVKVYKNNAYVVGDFSPEISEPGTHEHDNPVMTDIHGMQVFDLTQLLAINGDDEPMSFAEKENDSDLGWDVYLGGFDEAHNLVIDEETGFAAAVASDAYCGSEFYMMDLNKDIDDADFELGCYNSGRDGAVHDAQCAIYHGPDEEHQGKEICLAFMEDQFSIFDMTPVVDGTGDPIPLSDPETYPGYGYVHQGWFTPDHRYVGSNDELDELNAAGTENQHNTRTYMWDVTDLDNPKFIDQYEAETASIDHNMYFKGIYLHQANYVAGYRVLDASNIANGELEQVAYFDTDQSETDAPAFGGVWSGYFHYQSGAVALSQLNNGELFILWPTDEKIRNASDTDGTGGTGDPDEPVDVIPDSGRVHGSGYLHGLTSNDGDSDSDSDGDSDSDFEKIEFSFDVKVKEKDGERYLKGKLKLKDKERDIKIEAEEFTSLIPGGTECNGVKTSAEGGFVFRAKGEYNGLGVEFRVCGEDNGKHGKGKDGQAPDRFYLECTKLCDYNTAERTLDDNLDGGNIHLHDPIVWTPPGATQSSAAGEAPDVSDQTVITLDPILSDGPTLGQPMTLTAVVETASGSLANQSLTLHSKHENSLSSAVETISSVVDGEAVFTVSPLPGLTAYWVTLGDTESNRVTIAGGL